MNTITRQEVSASVAHEMVTAVVIYAAERNWNVCAAICDPRGHLVALARNDDVVTPAIQFAIDKAYTAGTLGRSTEAFFERAHSRPALAMGLANRERMLVFPGGLPIFGDGVCLGGLGVSGGQDEEDVECARYVIQQFGFNTE